MTLFNRPFRPTNTGICQYAIASITISCIIFELFDVQNIATLKYRLGFIEGHCKWHHSIDRIWVPIRLPL